MWAIDNRTAFAAERTWIRDADGAEVWIVAVKATYDIFPDGNTQIASQQPPVHSGPQPNPGLASLRYETDLGPAKHATDIILNGHAYAQDGRPCYELPIAFRVGKVVRQAKVHCDRFWRRGGLFSSPVKADPFLHMPLVYERAFGGDSPDLDGNSGNPVGCGIVPTPEGLLRLPNIESAERPWRNPDERLPVTCFGAIPPHWPGRRRFAGTYDQHWLDHRRPLLPADFDVRHWQIAPPDQQVAGRLQGGEEVVLVNLTRPGFARDGRLALRLPRLSLAFETFFAGGGRERSRAAIHSVILEPDFPRVSVVYHMTLPCHPGVNHLQRTVITQKGRPLDRICADLINTKFPVLDGGAA